MYTLGNSVREIVDNLFNLNTNFNNYVDYAFSTSLKKLYPNYDSINFYKENDCYVLEVLTPGLTKDDIDITVENERIRIKSVDKNESQKDQENETTKKYYLKSFSTKNVFDIRFLMIENTEVDRAELKDGILRVYMKKNEKNTIKINVA